ncbi:type I secretion C-terminal target domain-containing protein [Mesorhizobium sp. ZC-5]|nr:type I secretion C-terminal target domain-containing protein [Mesorhizobium sp. ZC-5]
MDSLGVGINDLILDYNDAQGDVVDLSALLESLSGAPTTAAEVDAVVNLVAGVGTTSIMVDDNGTAAGGNVTEVATLSGTHTVVAILFDDAQAPTDVA